ncbi:Galactose-1-phosphate uridylyltransferase, putative [Theobroma cacao]|uniref:Galactose-1-phosphate uridylyltransferase, putative n=1 Tax=Theobroma cacao TaxID=3641 RepID=A0A061G193_THECC|nr:Galactose-1-phosphate uridylyltransferase, putative [Theobroma cacao]
MLASKTIGITIFNWPFTMIMTVEEKATIIDAIDMKREESPMINLLGKDLRKSCVVYRDVRMPTNINTEVVEAKREIESDIMNILKSFFVKSKGTPVS